MPKKRSPKEENPKAFKLWINQALLQRMAESLAEVSNTFDSKQFLALASSLDALEMKPRVLLIRDQLRKQLPEDFKVATQILLKSLQSDRLKGFDLWPYTEFIQTYGLQDLELSLRALEELTQRFTSEFAVRPFIRSHTSDTLKFLEKCTSHTNVHIRRWASEGSRPRLPWGEKLHLLIEKPKLTLAILERLKHDPELYVRKSVANHLNDIAKDHPDLVVGLLKKWQSSAGKHSESIDWIIHRSLRTLIKNGHPGALELIGASQKIKIAIRGLQLNKKNLKMNDRLEFKFDLHSQATKEQKIVVDYIVHFVKGNKKTAPKVFKLKTFSIKSKEKISIIKRHHFKEITTRVYYSGVHQIEIQVNGKIFAKSNFILRA